MIMNIFLRHAWKDLTSFVINRPSDDIRGKEDDALAKI